MNRHLADRVRLASARRVLGVLLPSLVLVAAASPLLARAIPLSPQEAIAPDTGERQEAGATDGADTAPDESAYYTVEHFTSPEGEVLEVGGMGFFSDGRLALSTRRGQVWIVHDALADDVSAARFELAAEGLDEGLGLAVVPEPDLTGRMTDALYIVQRGELSRLSDRDGDGTFERIDTVNDGWGLSGNYHEFAFGLPVAPNGDKFLGLNVAFFSDDWWVGKSTVPYRGWILRVDADGQLHPFAHGFRSPCGLGFNAAGDLFMTDNQGDWLAAGPLHHVVEGGFYGHPASLAWTDAYRKNGATPSLEQPARETRRPAAVWFPYAWSRSAGNLVADQTGGAFGPFGDQLFVAELTNGLLVRVQLEKVRGEYQGACFLFRQQVGSLARVGFAPDGSLMGGFTNRGWGGLPPADGLCRVRWTGRIPLEMERVHLLQDGFEVRFTRPLAEDARPTTDDIALIQYDYDYWWEYGSPERHTTAVDVTSVEVSADRRTLTFLTEGLTAAMVARATFSGLVADDGAALLHESFAYTVNQLPEGPLTSEHVVKPVPPPPPRQSADEGLLRLTYGDALNAWQSDGWALVDAALDPADDRKFHTWPGVNALVNVGDPGASDFVGRYPLGGGTYHVEFMLPRGGRSTVWLQGRYGIALSDEAAVAEGAPPTGSVCLAEGPGPGTLVPQLPSYHGPGVWHTLEVVFDAPTFDAEGALVSPARLASVSVDDVVLHEGVVLSAPSAGAPYEGTASLAPLVVQGSVTPVALRTLGFKPTPRSLEAEGWIRLFNGINLDGWTLSPDAPEVSHDADDLSDASDILGGWFVEDGVLIGTGGRSHLFSPRGDYTDVEFRALVKVGDGSSSGMFVRATHGAGWPAGYEAQVHCAGPETQHSGSLVDLAPVTVQLVPPGTWFTQHIVCRETDAGTQVTISINGVVVTDYLDTERRHVAGHIALQQHHEGSMVFYRDIEVRDLSATR
jgi:hypothetical protein